MLRRLTGELPLPINSIDIPTQGGLEYFADLGVARVSFGPFPQSALTEYANGLFGPWR
ncbi:hypothetical protein ACFV4K_32580 [Nocardia sp. NPDC059764]|uniref:hypothetical protein n=1 Tax=Nocardia sp. NPDC059764 TaxID=3346939 RepID=UPI00365BE2F2